MEDYVLDIFMNSTYKSVVESLEKSNAAATSKLSMLLMISIVLMIEIGNITALSNADLVTLFSNKTTVYDWDGNYIDGQYYCYFTFLIQMGQVAPDFNRRWARKMIDYFRLINFLIRSIQ